jgi:hypothetical protein
MRRRPFRLLPGPSTRPSQDIHRISTAVTRERVSAPCSGRSPLHRASAQRAAPAPSTRDREPSQARLFPEPGSSVRTRAHRADMSTPLAGLPPRIPFGDHARSTGFVGETAAPERALARASTEGRGAGRTGGPLAASLGSTAGLASAGLYVLGELSRAAELARASGHRARNALPERVRPAIEPVPPSTRVRSRHASRAAVEWLRSRGASRARAERSPRASQPAALSLSRRSHALSRPNPTAGWDPIGSAERRSRQLSDAVSRCTLSNSRAALVSALRSPTGVRSTNDAFTSGLVRRRAPSYGH